MLPIMLVRVTLILLPLLWNTTTMAAAWRPLLPLPGQILHVPFLTDYLKDPSAFKITTKNELAGHEKKLQKLRTKLKQGTKQLQQYFSLLSELCYYHYHQRHTTTLTKAEESCHRQLIKIGAKLLKSTKVQRNKITYNVALSLFNLRKYREAHKQFSKLLNKSFSNPLALKAGLATYLIDLEIKKSISTISWRRLMAKFNARGKIIIHLATARHLAGLSLRGTQERKANSRYRQYLQKLSTLLTDVNSEAQEQVLAFMLGIVRQVERRIDWQRFPVQIETFAYTAAFPALLERQALFALTQKRFSAALGLYKRLLPMVKGRKTQQIVGRLLVIAKKSYSKNKNSTEYRKIMHLSNKFLKSNKEKKLLDKYVQFLINNESTQLKTMPSSRLRQLLVLIKDMLTLQTNSAYRISNMETMAAIHLRLVNTAAAVDIYYNLFKMQGGKALQYINLAISYQHQLAKWPQQLIWQKQPRQLIPARTRLLKMYEQKLPLLPQKDWHIIAQQGLLALNLNMKNKAWGLWINNMQHENKKIAPTAIGMVLSDYLRRKLWLKAEMLTKRCMHFAIVPQTNGKSMPIKKIYVDVMFKVIKYYVKINDLNNAKAKSIEFFNTFPNDTRQPENLLRLAEILIKTKAYVQAMFYLVKLVNNYQNNNYFRKGLLRAANLAILQGNEQKAVTLHRLFFQHYPQDKAIKSIVNKLVKLYKALHLYGDLQTMYNYIATSPRFSTMEKQKIEVAMMELEEKYGSSTKARDIATKIINQTQRDLRQKAIAASLLARYHYSRSDNKALVALERRLSPSRYEYKEVRNQLSFYFAENTRFVNAKIIESYEEKPVKFLAYLSKSFALIKNKYLEVCKFATSRFCLASYLSLVDRSFTYIDAVSTAELSAASTRQAYDLFTQDKKKLTDYFENQKQFFRNASIQELQKGHASSEWVSKSLVVSPELNLSYVNGHLSEPDFVQINIKKDLRGVN